jgi:hypothetical protein
MQAMDRVSLEHPGISVPYGFEVWDRTGKLILRTRSRDAVFRDRKAAYFRVNQTRKVYRIISKMQTEELASVVFIHVFRGGRDGAKKS